MTPRPWSWFSPRSRTGRPRSRLLRRHLRRHLRLESLEDRTLLSPVPIGLGGQTAAAISVVGQVDTFQVNIPEDGLLTAAVHASGLHTRLALCGPGGKLLTQSDGQSLTNADDLIQQHVWGSAAGTTYLLTVSGLGGGTGSFTLTTQFAPAIAPFQSLAVGTGPQAVATADLAGNGIADLVVVNHGSNTVSVLLGVGDGTFGRQVQYAVGSGPTAVVIGDFNHDGIPDLAVVNHDSNDVSILLGNGDGTFRAQERFAVGLAPVALVAGEFTGDGSLDLAVADQGSNDVSILLGNGDGMFQKPIRVPVGATPSAIVAGDFNGDGRLDLATTNEGSNDISILLGNGDGTFRAAASVAVADNPVAIVAADFNHDGHLDLATANQFDDSVSVLLGNGDGTFQPQVQYGVGTAPSSLVVGDFNGDGRLDLATANQFDDTVSVLPGNGDGTFQNALTYAAGNGARALAAADFNGDGKLDLATVNGGSDDVSIFLGNGDATFQMPGQTAAGPFPNSLVTADFNRDGITDLAVANEFGSSISVLLGQGDGTFQTQQQSYTNDLPYSIAAGDFNGDGRTDLVTVPLLQSPVVSPTDPAAVLAGLPLVPGSPTVFLGQGDGTFQDTSLIAVGVLHHLVAVGDFTGDGIPDLAVPNEFADTVTIYVFGPGGTVQNEYVYATGHRPVSIVTGDFNGDGKLDLAIANEGSSDIAVLLGNGDGTFQPQVRYAAGAAPFFISTAGFTGDGKLDLVTANELSNDVSVLLGNGDGTFQPQKRFAVGQAPNSIAIGDFNHDGTLDLATANGASDDISVLLGQGDGTFQPQARYAAGQMPNSIIAYDFTNSGNLDLATLNNNSKDVTVLLGRGDGTFGPPMPPASVGDTPSAVVVGDFNHDGSLDLAVANPFSDTVSIYLGNGDGTFQPPVQYAVGSFPSSIAVGDFNGDGNVDLAVTDERSDAVTVLLGNGDGTFRQDGSFAVGSGPVGVAVADFTHDGHDDLVVANHFSNDLSLLLGNGDGTFQPQERFAAGGGPTALAVGDFNGDGTPDVAVADGSADVVSVFLGNGDGTFQAPTAFGVGAEPYALVTGDFTGDGHTDLATANFGSNNVSILLGLGNGSFVSADATTERVRSTPLVADFGNGVPGVAILNQQGQILLRLGHPGQPGTFDPPVILNPDPANAVRDLAVVQTRGGVLLAALDSQDANLSIYRRGPNGNYTRTTQIPVPGAFPVRIAAADLDGDGLGDLVVATAGSDQVLVYRQTAPGIFSRESQVDVGANPSDIQFADVNGDGLPDIIVTNRFSGDASVLLNQGGGQFVVDERFRAGAGPFGLAGVNGSTVVQSALGTAGVVAGRFDGTGATDLVVTNSGTDSFSLLQGDGFGGFLNPQGAATFATGVDPTAVVVGDFNGDGNPDVAVLNEGSDTVSVFTGDGQGHFRLTFTAAAGNAPTGLAVADVNGDGIPDLLIGNVYGDVLTLLGKGNGTFAPYQRVDKNVSLAVTPTGPGQDGFVFGNESLDRLAVGSGSSAAGAVAATSVFQNRSDGILAPGKVVLADLNGDGIPDLIVANTGANEVLVYPALGDGRFGTPQVFFAGTSPVSVTVADVNGDGIPDLLVANEGSNDVSVLFGQGQGADWTMNYGPRLKVGLGPTAVAVVDVRGVQDLAVSNSESNNVYLLQGLGNGFFDDLHPTIIPTGQDPQQVLAGNFDGRGPGLVTVNAGSNDLTLISGLDSAPVVSTISSGGDRPAAAVAGDFTGDGFSDLLVANNGNGVVSLLLGGSDGLTDAEGFSRPDLAHPSDLAVSFANGNGLDFYVTDEGKEVAYRFAVDFGRADLLPVQDSNLALVATLLAGTPGEQETTPVLAESDRLAFSNFLLDNVNPHTDAAPGGPSSGTDEDQALVEAVRNLAREVVNRWLPTALAAVAENGPALVQGAVEEMEAWGQTLDHALMPAGMQELPLPDLALRPMLDGIAGSLLGEGRTLSLQVGHWLRAALPAATGPQAAEPVQEAPLPDGDIVPGPSDSAVETAPNQVRSVPPGRDTESALCLAALAIAGWRAGGVRAPRPLDPPGVNTPGSPRRRGNR